MIGPFYLIEGRKEQLTAARIEPMKGTVYFLKANSHQRVDQSHAFVFY